MKKGVFIVGAMFFAVVMALSAGAADFSVSGYYGIGYRAYRNTSYVPSLNVFAWDDHVVTEWTQRVDFTLTSRISENLMGVTQLRLDSFSAPWGTYKTGQNAMGAWTAEQNTVEVKQAYIDFKIPGLESPTWLRAGVMEHAIRPFTFLTVFGPGVQLRTSCPAGGGNVSVMLGWGKMREFDERQDLYLVKTQVEDGYVIVSTSTPAAEAMLRENLSENLYYALFDYKGKNVGVGAYAALAAGSGVWSVYGDPKKKYTIWSVYGDPKKKYTNYYGSIKGSGNIWWLGLYSDGKVGPVNYSLDLVFDTGREKVKIGNDPYGYIYEYIEPGKVKYSGWLGRVVLTYPYEKFNFGLGALYVSGDNYKKFEEKGKVTGFVAPYGAETMGPAGDSVVVIGGWGAGPGPVGDVGLSSVPFSQSRLYDIYGYKVSMAQEGWPGVWGVRLFADYKALNWLTLSGQVSYWGDTVKYGNAFEGRVADKKYDDSDIGFEVDLGATVNVYKNLTWRLVFGYLFAGDAADGKTKATDKKRDDPFAFVSTLILTF